ncbi:hypothetical protein [Actinacidiphila epipremni]|uniref:Uncharacterized protein n=1 Tax=Actinacidiphila epipremni TaxID=2053013 RepID=A0ABX0ZG15_9ACTN|nr:hypothetical protein [Actinacidiphila epipremni]NJP42740.1 hypothetical protein [Actinacidiphila epipremni]
MSDNTRRETASTGLSSAGSPRTRPVRRTPRHPAATRLVRADRRAPRGGMSGWPDAATAEALLAGGAAGPPPTVPADRLVRLLSAAREVRTTLDPAREAAALAAFRTAAQGRARGGQPAARGGGPRGLPAGSGLRKAGGRPGTAGAGAGAGAGGGRFAALRAALAVRRPRLMAAAVVSALALGGVAVGMAAAARSLSPGGGAGTGPLQTRPPAAVSPDGGRAGPWTAGPPARSARPAPAPGGPHRDRHADGHRPRGCRAVADRSCPPGTGAGRTGAEHGDGGKDVRDGGHEGYEGYEGYEGHDGREAKEGRDGRDDRGPRHTRPGHRSLSRPPGR